LHVVQQLVDVDKGVLEVWSGLDQIFWKFKARFVEGVMADVTFPERKNFWNQIQFEKFHRRQNIKHGCLLHPIAKTEELCRL